MLLVLGPHLETQSVFCYCNKIPETRYLSKEEAYLDSSFGGQYSKIRQHYLFDLR